MLINNKEKKPHPSLKEHKKCFYSGDKRASQHQSSSSADAKSPKSHVPIFCLKIKSLLRTSERNRWGLGVQDRSLRLRTPGKEKGSGCAGGGTTLLRTEARPWHSRGSPQNPITGPKSLLLIPEKPLPRSAGAKTLLMRHFPFLN